MPNNRLKAVPDIEQAKRFSTTARQLGADEDEAAFKAKLALIARQKPKDEPEEPKDEQ